MLKSQQAEIEFLAIKLAEDKVKLKILEGEIKEGQKKLLAMGVACDLETPSGKLIFIVQENYEVVDKHGVIKFLGQKVYNAHSTISKTGIEKAIGQLGVQELIDSDILQVKSMTEYFMLKAHK